MCQTVASQLNINLLRGRWTKGSRKSKLTNSLVTFPGMVVTTWTSQTQWIQLIYFPVGLASSQLVVSFFSGFFSVLWQKRGSSEEETIEGISSGKHRQQKATDMIQDHLAKEKMSSLTANGYYFFLMHLLVYIVSVDLELIMTLIQMTLQKRKEMALKTFFNNTISISKWKNYSVIQKRVSES